MILHGRRKIYTEFRNEDFLMDGGIKNLIKAINGASNTHMANKMEIEYLINYKNGNQTILQKEKLIRPEINNMVVLNHAQMVTRMITGYFLGTPIQYVQSGYDKKEEIEKLNKIVTYEDKASVDKEIAEYQSICGTAYRIIFTDGIYGDEVPFEDRILNPANTFVVYENNIAEKPIFAVTYYDLLNDEGSVSGKKVYCYTDFGLFTFVTNSEYEFINEDAQYSFEAYNIGGVPVIEYPNNIWRIGDWELCIGLMDAINALHSGRLDDIDQTVQSLLVFINAELDSAVYDEMREAGVVSLTNKTNNQSDVKNITNSLDHSGMNTFATELEELLYALLGIPDRNNRSGGGGDTGQAVELRDGWADLEIVARNKELAFKKSEKMALKIMLTIMKNKENINLSLLDINIKFSRNKNSNLLVKTQAYMNLIQTKTLDPSDCLTIVDLVSDVNDFVERGKSFWGDEFAGKELIEIPVEESTIVE